MAALNRPTNATYQTHENMTVDTQDNEDHTFCGIMFPIKCRDLLPIDHLIIKSVAVRGNLGPLTVWVSNKDVSLPYDPNSNSSNNNNSSNNRSSRQSYRHGYHTRSSSSAIHPNLRMDNDDDGEPNPNPRREREHRIPLQKSAWTKVYERTHKPCSYGSYTELVFETPLRLEPGEMRALYVHSTLDGDTAIVYDNSYSGMPYKRFEDDTISIRTGRAHVSPECFGTSPIWGWGNAWRDKREFVGTLAYGTVYKLWNPECQPKFGTHFCKAARAMLLCQRRWESPVSLLPDEAIYYILNMCKWDWFGDTTATMKDRRKRETAATKQLEQEQEQLRQKLLEKEREEEQRRDEKKRPVCETETTAKRRITKPNPDAPEPGGSDQAGQGCSNRCASAAKRMVCGDATTADEDQDDSDSNSDRKYAAMESDEDSHQDDKNHSEMQLEDSDSDEDDDSDDDSGDDDSDDDNVEDDDDDDDDESWDDEDQDHYHTASRHYFRFQDLDSDNEAEPAPPRFYRERQQTTANWLRHHFARAHILRALAQMEDQAIGQT